jgi:hypothetical protein
MMTISLRRTYFAVLFGALLCLGAADARAQSGMRSVEAVGTGGGTSALSTGPAALYSNPANLTVGPSQPRIELQLFRFGTYGGGDLAQFQYYNNNLVSSRNRLNTISEAETDRILREWFGGKVRDLTAYAEFVPVSFVYRPPEASWAAGGGIRIRAVETTGINGGLADLLFRGTEENRTVPLDGRFRAYNTIDLTGAFSYRFSSIPLSVGASPRIILGTGFVDGDLDSEVTVTDSAITHTFDYETKAAGPVSGGLYDEFNAFEDDAVPDDILGGGSFGVAGVGMGMDLGGTYTLREDLFVSMSITDLGLIRWGQDAQTVTPDSNQFRFEGLNFNVQRLNDEFDGNVGDYFTDQLDSLARASYEDVNRDRSAFVSGQPATLHLGSTWDQGTVVVNGGLSVGMNYDAGAVPRPIAVHAGGKVDLGPVPVQAGVRFWGNQAFTLSGAVGLHLSGYHFDLGGSVTPNTTFLGGGARYALSLSMATIQI